MHLRPLDALELILRDGVPPPVPRAAPSSWPTAAPLRARAPRATRRAHARPPPRLDGQRRPQLVPGVRAPRPGVPGPRPRLPRPRSRDARPGRVRARRLRRRPRRAARRVAHRAVVLAGYSMGGAVAQLLARQRPDLVAGLVLCATAAQLPVGPASGHPLEAALAVAASGVRLGGHVTTSHRAAAIRRRRGLEPPPHAAGHHATDFVQWPSTSCAATTCARCWRPRAPRAVTMRASGSGGARPRRGGAHRARPVGAAGASVRDGGNARRLGARGRRRAHRVHPRPASPAPRRRLPRRRGPQLTV